MKIKNKILKFILIFLISLLIGFLIGFSIGYIIYSLKIKSEIFIKFSNLMNKIPETIKSYGFYIISILLSIELFLGELFIYKMKILGNEIIKGIEDDNEADIKELKLSRYGAISTSIISIVSVLIILIYAVSYTNINIKTINLSVWFLLSIIFVISSFYEAIYLIRFVNLVIKVYPDRYGDPSSLKFTEQWVESCDEAEKAIIYRATFKSYTFIQKLIAFLLITLLITHIIFNTGILPIIICGIISICANLTYQIEAYKLSKKGKIQ